MESWQESYKKHHILANELAEKSMAQEILQIGLNRWDEDGELLGKGELNHIRLWLSDEALSDVEKQFIAESQKAVLNQNTQTQPENNGLLIGLTSANILALLCVVAFLYYAMTIPQSPPHLPNDPNPKQVAQLQDQITRLKQQNNTLNFNQQSVQQSLTTANQQIEKLTAQKEIYYTKWVLQAVEQYIEQQEIAVALLLKALEHAPHPILLERLYDIVARQPVQTLEKHQIYIRHATFSPDNQYVVTVSLEGVGYLWKVATGEVKQTFMLPDWSPLSYATFSQDGQLLLIVGGSSALIWDMTQQKQIGLLTGHDADILDASFSSDNQYVVTASQDKTARLWKAETTELLKIYEGHKDIVYTVKFTPNHQMIATGSRDGTAKLWQRETGQLIHSFGTYSKAVKYLCFQDNVLLAASFDGQIQSWNIETAQQLDSFHLEDTTLNSFDCQTDKMAASFANNTSYVWKLGNVNPLAQFTDSKIMNHVSLGKDILVAASESKVAVQSWKLQKLLYTIEFSKSIKQVVISSDGKYLLVVADKLAYIYPLFHSQTAITQAAESMAENESVPIQFDIESK